MALTFRVNSNKYNNRYMYVTCTQTPKPETNTSTIAWTLTVTGDSGTQYSTGPTTLKIGGQQVYYKARTGWETNKFPVKVGSVSGSLEVEHDANGDLSLAVSLSTAIYTSTVTTTKGTWELDSNPRGAQLVSASNFTDEENPTITYSNVLGEEVESLQAAISLTGAADDVAYRDIGKTDTSYTFELTEEERNVLRNATPNSNTITVRFYVKTIVGGVTYWNYLERALTIVNANPTLSATVTDSNSTTVALTGDSNKLVKYFSNATANASYSALKGASIASYSVASAGRTYNTIPATFEAVEASSFTFTAVDSRGNTTTKEITKTLVNYIKLTANLEATNPTGEGTMTVRVFGNYFNGSYGNSANTLTVQYRLAENGGAWGAWQTIEATPSGNSYDASATISVNYQSAYTVQARAVDALMNVESATKKVKSTPVFDWGENDFKFNVDVFNKLGQLIGDAEYTHSNSNGCLHCGNGLLIQWGKVVITPTAANTVTAATINFPITYDEVPKINADPQVQYPNLVTIAVGGGTTVEASKSSMVVYLTRTNTAATQVQWLAIGYKEVSA